jgi:hypothetical protein
LGERFVGDGGAATRYEIKRAILFFVVIVGKRAYSRHFFFELLLTVTP